MQTSTVNTLIAARRVVEFSIERGVFLQHWPIRHIYDHMGAVIADSILQSGLNYKTVVRPRVMEILERFPEKSTTSTLVSLVERGETSAFLNWTHHQKIERFIRTVHFLSEMEIETTHDLHDQLATKQFGFELQSLKGIGPKTVDYMACLVGVDSIAIDRHVRSFAKRTGIGSDDYYFLQKVFCYAADLLELSRRDFDSWIWRNESSHKAQTIAQF